jgi:hypothetical protein
MTQPDLSLEGLERRLSALRSAARNRRSHLHDPLYRAEAVRYILRLRRQVRFLRRVHARVN